MSRGRNVPFGAALALGPRIALVRSLLLVFDELLQICVHYLLLRARLGLFARRLLVVLIRAPHRTLFAVTNSSVLDIDLNSLYLVHVAQLGNRMVLRRQSFRH